MKQYFTKAKELFLFYSGDFGAMRITGVLLVLASGILAIVNLVLTIVELTWGGAGFLLYLLLGNAFVVGLFVLGIFTFRTSLREDIPELKKEIIVSTIFLFIILAVEITTHISFMFSLWDLDTGLQIFIIANIAVYMFFYIRYYVLAIRSVLKGLIPLAFRYMMIGGILTSPVGGILVLLAFSLRRHSSIEQEVTE